MFWNRKSKKPVLECSASDTAVCLHHRGFYYDEKPIHSPYQMLSIFPHDVDGDITFLGFSLRCASLILADYPFVLESVIGNDHLADCSPIIEAHRNSSGQFILAEKLRLLARVNTPTLVTQIPEYEHWLYECEFYAYREELSDVQVQAIANNLRNSEFALRIFYHSCHDYILIETAEDPSPCVKHIEELCSQEGRKVFY